MVFLKRRYTEGKVSCQKYLLLRAICHEMGQRLAFSLFKLLLGEGTWLGRFKRVMMEESTLLKLSLVSTIEMGLERGLCPARQQDMPRAHPR